MWNGGLTFKTQIVSLGYVKTIQGYIFGSSNQASVIAFKKVPKTKNMRSRTGVQAYSPPKLVFNHCVYKTPKKVGQVSMVWEALNSQQCTSPRSR